MTTPSGESAIVLSLGGFLASLPGGLQPIAFLTGFSLCVAGVIMRAGSELQRSSSGNGTEGIKPSKLLGWVAGGIASSLGVTIAYLILLQISSLPANLPELFWLLALGYYGDAGTRWLLNTTTNAAKGVLGGVFKGFPSQKDGGSS